MHVLIVTSDSLGLQGFAFKARRHIASPVVRGQYCANTSAKKWLQNLQFTD